MNLLENDIFNSYNLRRIEKKDYQAILDSKNELDLISLVYHARYYNRDYKEVMNGTDFNLKENFKEKYTLVNPHDILQIFLENKNIKALWMIYGRYPKFFSEIYEHVKNSNDEDYKLDFIYFFDVSFNNKMDFLQSVNIPPKIFWNAIVKKNKLSSSKIISYMLKKYGSVILFMYLFKENLISSVVQYEELLKLLKNKKSDFIDIDEFFYERYLRDLNINCWDKNGGRIFTEFLYTDDANYEYKKEDQISFKEVFVINKK